MSTRVTMLLKISLKCQQENTSMIFRPTNDVSSLFPRKSTSIKAFDKQYLILKSTKYKNTDWKYKSEEFLYFHDEE
jgi:hypothetical protein